MSHERENPDASIQGQVPVLPVNESSADGAVCAPAWRAVRAAGVPLVRLPVGVQKRGSNPSLGRGCRMSMNEEIWDAAFIKIFGVDESEPIAVHPLDSVLLTKDIEVEVSGGEGCKPRGTYVVRGCRVLWEEPSIIANIVREWFDEWALEEDAVEAWENEGGACAQRPVGP